MTSGSTRSTTTASFATRSLVGLFQEGSAIRLPMNRERSDGSS